MNFEISILGPEHDPELTAFLDALGSVSPSVLAYHYPFYRDVIRSAGAGEPCYFAARSGRELAAVLPAFRAASAEGAVYSSLPFFGPNAGVLAAREILDLAVPALAGALIDRAERENAIACSVYTPFLEEGFERYDDVLRGAMIVEKSTQYLDLSASAWSKDVAYDLRKAERLGVSVSTDARAENVAAFYALYQSNCEEFGIPLKPRACIDHLVRDELLGTRSAIYFAFHEGTLIGGLLVLRSKLTASYYIPCTLSSSRTLQPGTVLIDRAVADARAAGVRYWNWESSPSRDTGVFQFKKKWGSLESPYRIYVKTLRESAFFQALGTSRISASFPHHFVYPFSRL